MSDCRERLLQDISVEMQGLVDQQTAEMISGIVLRCLANYEISERCTDLVPVETPNERILKRYVACLRIDGKSEKTIYQYHRTCARLAEFLQKPFTEMGAYDIRYYLGCEKERGISGRSLENTRANISAFFQWLANEEMIVKNPMTKIKPIKYTDVTRMPFSDTDIDALRSACKRQKERAIIELLLSSGIRVSELSQMDITDLDFRKLTVHVLHGKGDKERVTYMTAVAAKHIEKYLTSRKDNLTALFLNQKKGRLCPNGVREILNRIAARAGVANVHPHRFRRTFATGLAARGMEIQEIQKLMGHSNINTTMEYVYTNDGAVSASYRKYSA